MNEIKSFLSKWIVHTFSKLTKRKKHNEEETEIIVRSKGKKNIVVMIENNQCRSQQINEIN